MDTYIQNYNSDEFKEYLEKLEIFYSYKLKILNKKQKNQNIDGLSYNESKDKFELNYNNISLNLTKPKYKNIFEEIDNIKEKKNELKLEYNELQYRILHNLNDEKDYKKYQKIVDELINLDEEVKQLIGYYIKVNTIQKQNERDNKTEIYNKTKELEELFNKINNETKNINDYLELVKEIRNLKNTNYKTIDYIITELPKVEGNNIKSIVKKEKKEKKKKAKKSNDEVLKESNSKLKKKLKKKLDNTPTEKLDKLEENIKKKLFEVFKFKNQSECASRAHSSKYFTKKPDLIKLIKKSKEIEKRLPSNYQGMSKTKICEELYKL